jgi:hypothetical protein
MHEGFIPGEAKRSEDRCVHLWLKILAIPPACQPFPVETVANPCAKGIQKDLALGELMMDMGRLFWNNPAP